MRGFDERRLWQAVEGLSWRSHYLLRRRRCAWCAWAWWHRDIPFWARFVAVMDRLDRKPDHCRRSAEYWETTATETRNNVAEQFRIW